MRYPLLHMHINWFRLIDIICVILYSVVGSMELCVYYTHTRYKIYYETTTMQVRTTLTSSLIKGQSFRGSSEYI